ncbi:MAG: hypothetical protein H7X93_12225, partial [Sphingomonadaceae bacterium]|nr:hypothetical protein [Sphingomonadaceae bacterium]
ALRERSDPRRWRQIQARRAADYRQRYTFAPRRWVSRYRPRACAPGLAWRTFACVPSGGARARFAFGQRFAFYDRPRPYSWTPYRYRLSYGIGRDRYDYRYYNGYMYRIDPATALIAAAIPLLGGGFSVGHTLPVGYGVYNVPQAYRSVYYDDDYHYRYGDGAIYRVDPASYRIEGVCALLTNDFVVGQPMPLGYDVYNVPFGYRDAYYDDEDYWYRYNDGRVWQIDADTQLIVAAVALTAALA